MSFGDHQGVTKINGQYCCYVCRCPFEEASEPADGVPQLPWLEPVDERPCVPTWSWRIRMFFWPVLNVLQIGCIFATQGPRVLNNRLCWWAFGPDWHSSCDSCGGSGWLLIPINARPGEPRKRVTCSSCNGFHD